MAKPRKRGNEDDTEATDKRREQYNQRTERERQRQSDQSETGRDIAPAPPVADQDLRNEVWDSLQRFCEVCLAEKFVMAWSPDHLEVIRLMELSVKQGMLYALAMPRGSGKTTLVLAACLWAILTGRAKYLALICADKDAATELLAGVKTELETKDTLLELFPEAAYRARRLEGKPNKATGQLYNGKRTFIQWKGPRVVLASIPGSACSNAIIEARGILGRIRGMTFTRADGQQVRPDIFVADDIQTDRSAFSLVQIRRRLAILTGSVLGLAGPGVSMAGFCTCTVIAEGDAADQLLDRDIFPDWKGQRFQLVNKWPESKDARELWEEYANIRSEGLRTVGDYSEATAFYKRHRRRMDAGAKVAWEARKTPAEISALQHAYNLRYKSPDTFHAEYQNRPKTEESDVELLTIKDIESKVSGYRRLVMPPSANLVTAFIDVQQSVLYWQLSAFDSTRFDGWNVAYGTWPKQTANYFTLRGVTNTLENRYPRRGLEARLRSGLFDLIDEIIGMADSMDGQLVNLLGIDARWEKSSKVVKAVCREHPARSILLPFFNRAVSPTERQMSEWQKKPGERRGDNWTVRRSAEGRHAVTNVNYWKSFFHARLNTDIGDAGSFSLYTPRLSTEHRMVAEQYRSEKVQIVHSDNGRSGEIWKLPPSKPDNHLFDCAVGCTMLASMCGAALTEFQSAPPQRRQRRRRTSFTE